MPRVSLSFGSVVAELQPILRELKAAGTEKKRASAIRVGIPMGRAFGVSVGHVRSLAKRLKGRHELAEPLWTTGIHEARLLAVLIADPNAMRRAAIERWLQDVISWDLCDHLCGDLVIRRSDALVLAQLWIKKPELYFKRAAFAVIAQLAVHDKKLDGVTISEMLELVVAHAGDPRPRVRQAASWALRSMGKRDDACRQRALSAAVELIDSEDVTKRWVGRDALRELESLQRVPERVRLLKSSAKTARKHARPNAKGKT